MRTSNLVCAPFVVSFLFGFPFQKFMVRERSDASKLQRLRTRTRTCLQCVVHRHAAISVA